MISTWTVCQSEVVEDYDPSESGVRNYTRLFSERLSEILAAREFALLSASYHQRRLLGTVDLTVPDKT